MFNRSRSRPMPILLILGIAIILGPAGCASSKPREKWWQFWRPKNVRAVVAEEGDRVILPPPPGAMGVKDGNTGALDGQELAGAETPENPVIRRPGDPSSDLVTIHFAFDSYALDQTARELLNKNVEWIASHPSVEILIEGHCDERGTVEYNYNLGQRRANVVKAYLIEHGVSPGLLHTISYGEERPLEAGHGEAAWSQNRRAQFLIYKSNS